MAVHEFSPVLLEAERYAEPPLKISGDADRYDHRNGNDDYKQPGDLFRLMNAEQQGQLFKNIEAAMGGVPDYIIQRQLAHIYKADPTYGGGVAEALGVSFKPGQMAAK